MRKAGGYPPLEQYETPQSVSLNIVQALEDENLLGGLPTFHDLSTWAPWLAFAKAVHGLAMSDEDLERFRKHTGRQTPRAGGYPEAVAVVGVQSGKSRIGAALVDVAALKGEAGTHAILVGQDHRGAMRVLLRYAREPFERLEPFKAEVVRSTADTLELRNGVSLSAYPCRPEAVRGLRACIVVIDELAFFTATDGRPVDKEILRVARGRVATTGGKLIILSSAYFAVGALNDLDRQHYGREDSSTLVWKAPSYEMNSTLPADYLERMRIGDPEAYRSEVLGEFRAGVSNLLDPEALAACVDAGVRERAFSPGQRTFVFCDPASGTVTGRDAFSVGISCLDYKRDLAVLQVIRSWKPPFNPSSVIAEVSDLLKQYGLREVSGDRYAPGFVEEHFRSNGITYCYSERTRSELYLEFLPALNSGRVLLLDDPEMLREFRGLERRRGTSGRDRVDHRPGPGSHDDKCNSAAGALVLALTAKRHTGTRSFNMFTGEIVSGWDHEGNEWRDGVPFNGIFPPATDAKGRPLSHWARFVNGDFVGHVVHERKGETHGEV